MKRSYSHTPQNSWMLKAELLVLVFLLTGCAALERQGDAQLEAGNYQQAAFFYQEQLKETPDALMPRAKLGFVYLKTSRMDDAAREFVHVLEHDASHAYATLYMGMTYIMMDQYREAMLLWQGYSNPDNPLVEKEILRLLTLLKLYDCRQMAKESVQQESAVPAAESGIQTIAVAYYKDLSPNRLLSPLRKGLSSLIITYLSKIESLTVVERIHLQALLEEMKFGRTGMVDKDSAPKVGRLVGAEHLVTGKLLLGSIETYTSLSSSSKGTLTAMLFHKVKPKAFFDLPIMIVNDIVKALNIQLTPSEKAAIGAPLTTNFKAFLYYGQALYALDAGNWKMARNLFQKALEEDPFFYSALEGLEALPEFDFFDLDSLREMTPVEFAEVIAPQVEKAAAVAVSASYASAAAAAEAEAKKKSEKKKDEDAAAAYLNSAEAQGMEREIQDIMDAFKEAGESQEVEFRW